MYYQRAPDHRPARSGAEDTTGGPEGPPVMRIAVAESAELLLGLLHGRQGALGLGQRACLQCDRRRLGGDGDRLARCRVAALARLGGGLELHLELHEAADLDLLGLAELGEDEVLESRD